MTQSRQRQSKVKTSTKSAPETAQRLTWMQQAFIDAFLGQANGNATEACRIAGYKGSNNVLAVQGKRNMDNAKISLVLQQARAKTEAETKDRREKRLKDLDQIIDNDKVADRDRIKAIELEGKMCGWLSTTINLETRDRQAQLDRAEADMARRISDVMFDTTLLPDGTYATDAPESARAAERQGAQEPGQNEP